jgi:hypothetical protein
MFGVIRPKQEFRGTTEIPQEETQMRASSRRNPRVVAGGALLGLAIAFFLAAPVMAAGGGSPPGPAVATPNVRSYPPDLTPYHRPLVAEDLRLSTSAGAGVRAGIGFSVVDAVVNNTNPILRLTDTFNDGETSLAINRRQPNEVVITAFSGSWGTAAPLWLSRNAGDTWTKEFSINPPPGVSGVPGCPCDQTVDFGVNSLLAGTFLTVRPTNIYSALTRNPAITAFHYFGSPAQATNHLDGLNNEDQPQLLVGPRPSGSGENVYVAYDDFNTAPNMRVAVAAATDPLNFTRDHISGIGTGFVNPGHRLAIDPVTGAVYSLFQRRIAPGPFGSQNINFMLNRSTDGGSTWSLNGSPTGIIVANANSTQPTPKFCTVNALLGGADHAAVDPQTGDLFYVYGTLDKSGVNQLALRRLTDNGAGGLSIGPSVAITTGSVNAAIPSVAIADNGTIGVFYYTCDRVPPASSFPVFTAHFAISSDHGASFHTGIDLETFLSPALESRDPRQRVLGDYMQVKAAGLTFYGSFTGNGAPFGRTTSNNDPIFFRVSVP